MKTIPLLLSRRIACAISLICVLSSAPAQTRDSVAAGTPDFASFVSQEEAIVVSITSSRMVDEQHPDDDEGPPSGWQDGGLGSPFEPAQLRQQQRSLASGFIIAADGYILTSAHAVSGVEEIFVRLAEGRQFSAKTIGLDKRSDVALIKIEANGLPIARIGDPSRLKVGDWVAAIGAPFGLERSVTAGIVSAKPRYVEGGSGMPYIQTDAAINRGSSGGPLFNLQGEVIGINSMIYSENGGYMGVSFTLPIDIAMAVAAELRSHGHVTRAQFGAQVQELTPELARSFGLRSAGGALVVRVQKQSPAERAGIRRGDIVLGIGERSDASYAELQQRVAASKPGSVLSFNVWRRGRIERLAVTLGEMPVEQPAVAAKPPAARFARLGLVMNELAAEERALLRTDASLWVRQAHGQAMRAGLRSGDLIVAINDTPVARLAEFDAALAASPPGNPVALLVVRAGVYGYMAVATQEDAASP